MDQMFEMYRNYPDKYDDLVLHEDFNDSLLTFLEKEIYWKEKTVCEFGAGTGRVTQLYIKDVNQASIHDSSISMLEKAKLKLNDYNYKIKYGLLDNNDIASIDKKYDIVIEGWSFGHLVVEKYQSNSSIINNLVSASMNMAKDAVIIIETMGTNVDKPKAPGDVLPIFYRYLCENGFIENILRTDYRFPSYIDAKRIMGSFFGIEMAKDIEDNKKSIIEEYTGIWILRK